jgi:hypothetical protein
MKLPVQAIYGLALLAIVSSVHAQAKIAPEPTEPEVHVRFEAEQGAFAELELVRSVDEESGEEKMAFTGELVSSEGKVLIDSFTIGADMEHLASVSDAYTIARKGTNAFAWGGGGPASSELMTLDDKDHPASVVAESSESGLTTRVDVFNGLKEMQTEFVSAGGDGSVAVSIALMFRDLHTGVSRSQARGEGCSVTFLQCVNQAKCVCGSSEACCEDARQGQSADNCCVSQVVFNESECSCSITCKDDCGDSNTLP